MNDRTGKKFLIISGCPGAPHRYRCENKKEQLESLGHRVIIKNFYEIDIHAFIPDNDLVILYRVPFNLYLYRMILACRTNRIPVVFDVDDMVFIPSYTPLASALSTMSLSDVDLYIEGVRRYARTIALIETAMVST